MITSKAITALYTDHPFYCNRLDTDKMFLTASGSSEISGRLDHAIRFIEDYQLMDPELWRRFVTQFRATDPKADDADLGWRGEYWGKMMRGACFTYRYTKNKALYDILTETVKDMMTTQDEHGRISSYSKENEYKGWDIWSRKYVLLGMQYFMEICEDEALKAEITECMCKQVDYMTDTIGYESEGKVLITKTSTHWHGMNASSVLEPVVRLYNLTKKQKYLNFAMYIIDCGVIYDEGVSIFELAYEDKLDPYQYPIVKAYEMMSCFEGLLEFYRVTKLEKWKTAIINFARRVIATDISVIGSAGCTHELFDHTLVRQTNTEYNGVLQETCVTVTWLKFCFQLLCLTGDPKYADEMEKAIYNALMGAINFKKDQRNGNLPFDSYSPLLFNTRMRSIGGMRVMADGTFYGCCACIGSAGTGLIGMSALTLTNDGAAINLFANAVYNITTPNGAVAVIRTETEYPLDGNVNVTVDTDSDEEIALYVRIPAWSERTLVSLNGEAIKADAGTYLKVSRVWKKDDYLTLEFDMRCKLIKAVPDPEDKNSAYHVSLRRGPIALARDSRLPGDIESIVDLAPDKEGYVPCELSDTDIEHDICVKVKEANGNEITMIDYASAGQTWDEGSMTTVWLPTRNYWHTDLGAPVYISCPNFWNSSPYTFYLVVTEDGSLVVSTENASKFTLEAVGEENFKIRAESGAYVAISEDKSHLTTAEEGEVFTVKRYAQNRYKFYVSDGRALIGSNDPKNVPFIALGEPSWLPNRTLRITQA